MKTKEEKIKDAQNMIDYMKKEIVSKEKEIEEYKDRILKEELFIKELQKKGNE